LRLQILICGIGGQGVLFLTRVLGEAALLKNKPFISSETHGMAVRGGSVVSHIKIGNFNSPLIRSGQADIVFVLSESEMAAYGHYLKNEGSAFINSTRINNENHCDATGLAIKAGSIKALNLGLLGYALAKDGFPFSYNTIKDVVKKITSKKLLSINLKALELGYSYNS
jgi:indolepyruvate ferredoxin oxidoreductase beta subunit